ncbi:reverse transcriptase [Gossypium australe]|uniref:Reverse transcriptase n=1 Tax=Gossypium australe TaxID=47621 RepID=A0A5B6VIJ0_9ROSI|nr:reverse transcriptase [Gossypium australe]
MMGSVYINAISEEIMEGENLSGICPFEPGSVLNNWTAEEIPIAFRTISEFSNINDISDAATGSESSFEQDTCLEGFQDFEDDIDCGLSPGLLKMVEQEEKQILPHEETLEVVTLEERKAVKIGTCITEKTKRDLVDLLQEFKDVFAWSYQDMSGLSTDIVVHRLSIKEDCKLVQQKLRRMRPDIVLKIKEEVKKQFDAEFLWEIKYSEWVANIMPVSKKDGKVRMCVDYRDLNKSSPNNNFPLPRIDTLVDNTAGYSLFSLMDGFSGSTQRRSGKLLGFIVSRKGIEIDSDKVRAIQELPPPRTQKEVRGFLGMLNYITRFISQLTEKCDPVFCLLKKHNPGVWDDECQKAFDRVK